MMCLLIHIGLPAEFVTWILILYHEAESVVHHKNWLTESFLLKCGVQQGCPLSCHLFNLVGQVLIYSLRDSGYFEWWLFAGDPCSMYADDIALFISDMTQLTSILKHITYVGYFTGLTLNIDKTIAFDLTASSCLKIAGVEVRSAPVKYLGVTLGLGDLSKQNFEKPLRDARAALSKWSKRSLTIDAKILVLKTFVILVFVHVMNTTYISMNQLDVVQKLCWDFLWQGWNKVKPSVMYASMENGGYNMANIKSILHGL